jgi:hypothetical protein
MHMGLALFCNLAAAATQDVKLAWNANPESNIAGYVVGYGTESGNLSQSIDVGNNTTATLAGLPLGVTHFAAVQAYNTQGLLSDPSAEISFVPHIKPPALVKNQSGAEQPDIGSTLDFGMVRVGALSDARSFTVTNTGTTTLTGLRFEIDGAMVGNFPVSGIPVTAMFVRNGGFEENLDKWTATGNVIPGTLAAASGDAKVARFSGLNKPNTGVLKQSFATTPGVTYQLAFDVAVESINNTNPQKLRTTILGSRTLASDDLTLSGRADASIVWSARTLDFTADSTRTEITFADISTFTSNVDILIDRVRIIDPTPLTADSGPQVTTLAPGKSTTFTINFKPTTGGLREAMLSLIADDVPMVLYEVKLAAAGSIQLDGWLAESGIPDGPGGNADKDALNNLQEYAFGTNPLSPQTGAVSAGSGQWVARGTPAVLVRAPGDGGFQGLFARRKDHASVKLRYMPQFSADLIEWVDANSQPVALGDDGEMELISISAPEDINGMPARFFRVGVEQVRAPDFFEWLANTGADSGTLDNPDGDALNNLQEFAFGTDPRTAQGSSVAEVGGLIASRGAPAVRVTQSPDPQLHGMFGRRKEFAAAGLAYRPQFSADLIKWVDADSVPVKLADDGEMEIVSVAAPPMIDGQPSRFFRVGVEFKP